jgi:hypothetical protein
MGKFVVRVRPALRVALVAGAAAALIVGSRSNAADHGDAPYSANNQLVSSELRPLAGQQASGIVHLGHKREGQDSVAAIFVNLVPGESYTLGLTRRACRGLPEVSQFFDIPGVIVADSNGTASVRRSGLDLTRRNLPPAKSGVLRTTTDDDPVSCGRLRVSERLDSSRS